MDNQTNKKRILNRYFHWIILGVFICGLFIFNPTTDDYVDQLIEATAKRQNVQIDYMRAYAKKFWDMDDVERSNFIIFSVFTIKSPSGKTKCLGIAKRFIYL